MDISLEHFDPAAIRAEQLRRAPVALSEVLVEQSTYHRGRLKQRLFLEGVKTRECELCGQGETWRGRRMALILDHINGVPTDNRLENLRIVCPNCAGTLETHCGRKNRQIPVARECLHCGASFTPKRPSHRYCSSDCGSRWERGVRPRLELRRVERPPYQRLMQEIAETSYLAVGRRYGVSGTAIRKWVRLYEREAAEGQRAA